MEKMMNSVFMKTRRALAVFLAVAVLLGFHTSAFAVRVGNQNITSNAAFVMDFETGAELFSYYPDLHWPPASVTKVVTVFLVYEAMARGEFDLDTVVPISAATMQVVNNPGLSNVPLSRSGRYTVGELIDTIFVASSCASAKALAELVSGTETEFVKLMNARMAELGIDFHFLGCYGGAIYAYITARGMATLMRNMFTNFPDVLTRSSLPTLTFAGRTYKNTNKLLGVYEGLDGFKTGTITQSKENFLGTAERDGHRIITVTLGSSWGKRFTDTTVLLDYGFEKAAEHHARLLEARKVPPSNAAVMVGDRTVNWSGYLIDGHNYFNIRDVAISLRGTPWAFDIGWHGASKTILLNSGRPYTRAQLLGRGQESVLPELSSHRVMVDGVTMPLTVYQIEGRSYFQLRELSDYLGFPLSWDGESKTIRIG